MCVSIIGGGDPQQSPKRFNDYIASSILHVPQSANTPSTNAVCNGLRPPASPHTSNRRRPRVAAHFYITGSRVIAMDAVRDARNVLKHIMALLD